MTAPDSLPLYALTEENLAAAITSRTGRSNGDALQLAIGEPKILTFRPRWRQVRGSGREVY
ncbi:hypothetical protein ACFWVC_01360 [Streptomyces sp. NPDC058691]|uniref:hypothetical protein n=1 Tax=Streptomyces sp. NPDC058691 TaxID=3346601 RepID=UPI003659680A